LALKQNSKLYEAFF